MKNLDQIRAAKALEAAEGLTRQAVSKIPGLILNNGLLSAAAFCDADGGGDNRDPMKKAMTHTAQHLAGRGITAGGATSIQAMIADLCAKDSLTLQRATTEALDFLSYLKRFAKKDQG